MEGFAGCKLWAPRVLLVATHSGSGVEGDPDGPALVAADELRRRYESDLIIEPARVFAVDSVSGRSGAEVTALKRAIASAKQAVCQVRQLNRELRTQVSDTCLLYTSPSPRD